MARTGIRLPLVPRGFGKVVFPPPRSLLCWMLASAALLISGGAQAVPLTTGLEGYWTFDGTANDLSGNGNNLVLGGGAAFAPGGQFGQALSLDGAINSNAHATTNNPAFDLGTTDFTIQFWANLNQIGSNPQILIEDFPDRRALDGRSTWLTAALSSSIATVVQSLAAQPFQLGLVSGTSMLQRGAEMRSSSTSTVPWWRRPPFRASWARQPIRCS